MKKVILLHIIILSISCAQSSHSYNQVVKGNSQSLNDLISVTGKGPIKFTKVNSANWEVDREGLIDLTHPKAKAAGLKEGKEPIQIYFYLLEHPIYGKYLIDTGISKVFKKDQKEWPLPGFLISAMNFKAMDIQVTTDEWLIKNKIVPNAVFLTHMHTDHIMGTLDLPKGTTLYTGPKESRHRGFLNMFVQGATDRLVTEDVKIEELEFPDKNPELPQIIDFFGDKSLFVIWVSGHTPGSLAFLIQTPSGPELVLGDTCHTAWGWENGVPPGSYTSNGELNLQKLNFLKDIAIKIPKLRIHPGHQSLKP